MTRPVKPAVHWNDDAEAAGPLAGVRVVDLTELLPGPFLTQSLVDMGADVLKVERPPHGDNARRLAPGLFGALNRGKRSIFRDLKDAGDLAAVHEAIGGADVLIESYRPGVMRRLGLDYDHLRERCPRLIYLSLTGFGQEGPHADLPGHDINYLAAAGALSLTGAPGGPPQPQPMLPIADLAGASTALSALLAALYQRTASGQGQYLDVSLVDSVLHWMTPRLGLFRQKGAITPDTQRAMLCDKPAYGVFRCKDGRCLTIAALEEHFWRGLNAELRLFAADDPRCADHVARSTHAGLINARLAACVAEQDADALMARLADAGLPVFPVLDTAQAMAEAQTRSGARLAETPAGCLPGFPVHLHGMA
ncbi:CaiB/BaiF CoA transferase family protein [Cupriavidus oxalaticus]|uniref:CoA transferase n=1 Tax=Cupriavidus oxalaticus TaxID=96344 RepID=A0A5P3VB93_9BURK|nr:CaiB/BaiF CoA-transferase family protein [Cupriavidus oxalaticus]QEZ43634.1 CoA transferase [Cupriavidus oxalaticus]